MLRKGLSYVPKGAGARAGYAWPWPLAALHGSGALGNFPVSYMVSRPLGKPLAEHRHGEGEYVLMAHTDSPEAA